MFVDSKTYVEKKFFKIPIKVYDLYSLMNVEVEEDKMAHANQGLLEPIPVAFSLAEKACIPEDIIAYVQGANKGQTLEDVEKEGFQCTVITIREGEETAVYECLWPIKKFEEKLNERMQAYIA